AVRPRDVRLLETAVLRIPLRHFPDPGFIDVDSEAGSVRNRNFGRHFLTKAVRDVFGEMVEIGLIAIQEGWQCCENLNARRSPNASRRRRMQAEADAALATDVSDPLRRQKATHPIRP